VLMSRYSIVELAVNQDLGVSSGCHLMTESQITIGIKRPTNKKPTVGYTYVVSGSQGTFLYVVNFILISQGTFLYAVEFNINDLQATPAGIYTTHLLLPPVLLLHDSDISLYSY
jgi:hypothetical protein